ncbi:hypothetical protein Q7Z55_10430 [Glaesserella parasuis]|uniref:hypothetical protein n=1 Tax=Glaesserella parasuis TaxID=738 RepID=UPI0004364459|nr:hypothetical protein [Glaesserella parasuis]EYE71250.1 hypothetical protein HPNK_11242 [Glaesserella parasuis str. Nagasaki]MCT8609166.1 hypothetical protein [Glaesserella parasuis]MCT8784784.1 hypothetical protein [Glaesserella parasuis]MDE3955386.1 hypothetical protein [Glaesserella parasuis]MDE4007239.1 hypothetical protein [Glaesserella parasuis]
MILAEQKRGSSVALVPHDEIKRWCQNEENNNKTCSFRLAMLTVLLGLSPTVVANDVNSVLNKGVEAEFYSSFLTMGKIQI